MLTSAALDYTHGNAVGKTTKIAIEAPPTHNSRPNSYELLHSRTIKACVLKAIKSRSTQPADSSTSTDIKIQATRRSNQLPILNLEKENSEIYSILNIYIFVKVPV